VVEIIESVFSSLVSEVDILRLQGNGRPHIPQAHQSPASQAALPPNRRHLYQSSNHAPNLRRPDPASISESVFCPSSSVVEIIESVFSSLVSEVDILRLQPEIQPGAA